MPEILYWEKCASVTTGGKPYFYRAYVGGLEIGRRERIGTVVWHRGQLAYAVDYCGRPLGWSATVAEGRKLVHQAHSGR